MAETSVNGNGCHALEDSQRTPPLRSEDSLSGKVPGLYEKPKLRHIYAFPISESTGTWINILDKIGEKYYELAAFLLYDDEGTETDALVSKHKNVPKAITREIMTEWLKRSEVKPTWITLLETFKKIGLSTLANEIQMAITQENGMETQGEDELDGTENTGTLKREPTEDATKLGSTEKKAKLDSDTPGINILEEACKLKSKLIALEKRKKELEPKSAKKSLRSDDKRGEDVSPNSNKENDESVGSKEVIPSLPESVKKPSPPQPKVPTVDQQKFRSVYKENLKELNELLKTVGMTLVDKAKRKTDPKPLLHLPTAKVCIKPNFETVEKGDLADCKKERTKINKAVEQCKAKLRELYPDLDGRKDIPCKYGEVTVSQRNAKLIMQTWNSLTKEMQEKLSFVSYQ